MNALFITGTGTEIGKTFVTTILCHQLRLAGRSVRALKPILSGYDPSNLDGSDSGILLSSLGEEVTEASVAKITPWRFFHPLSPDMAAAREGRSLDLDDIVAFCSQARGDPLLIEGVGGAMVPLNAQYTVLNWIEALDIPTLVVCGSYLGTISHTLTTVAAIEARGISVSGLVICESEKSPVPPTETAATIARFTGNLPISIVPRIPPGPFQWRYSPDLTPLINLTKGI